VDAHFFTNLHVTGEVIMLLQSWFRFAVREKHAEPFAPFPGFQLKLALLLYFDPIHILSGLLSPLISHCGFYC
jgi:hypothetical protein